jgi:hypothetical protein
MRKKYEYKREFVPRYYPSYMKQPPELDCLEKAGEEGWLLCFISDTDCGGTKILYFCREMEQV